jgi:Septum formation
VLPVAALAGCSDDDESPVVDLQEQSVGVCLDFPDDVGPEITDLPEVDCAEQHTHEIIAIVTAEGDVYPGFEALETDAQAKCLAEFEPYVGTNPFDSELFTSWLLPTLTSWDREDDRQIVCVVGNTNGAPLVGSVRSSTR